MRKRIKAIICSALSLIFGGIGIQKFYLGQNKRGILYILFFWTGIPYLLCIIDLLRFIFMSEKDFDSIYNKEYRENLNKNGYNNDKFNDAIDIEYSYVNKKDSDKNENPVIEKALEYYESINNSVSQIYDYNFSSKVKNLNNIFKYIIDKIINDDDDKKEQSVKYLKKMLEYNIPTTLKLINSYIDLSSSNTENSNNIKSNIEESIESVTKYLNNILENIQKEDIIDIVSDIDVLKSNLKKEGHI
ncbi:TM2 domain-containing protein [Brachyspira sp.]|uniref:TM2 domain-containing protein n=1 Tax=Brachyspira sp. TaxID=1977261 RepID=UPI00262E510C|nr:TM2 domain-containing protein [Brachyspira sp.]